MTKLPIKTSWATVLPLIVCLSWVLGSWPLLAQGVGSSQAPKPWQENAPSWKLSLKRQAPREMPPPVRLERISTAVPWPRGLAFMKDRLVVLARGRHRRAGGCDPKVQDQAGSLFKVDPAIFEPVVHGQPAGAAVKANAALLARPRGGPFHLWDHHMNPADDTLMDRPYCTLVHDPVGQNLFICGYSGVDLNGSRFRKNATDSIHRFDLRSKRWMPVEAHNPNLVPKAALSDVVPNQFYPSSSPASSQGPRGWLNGPDGAAVAGHYLYAAGKDNHVVAWYDLTGIRKHPDAPEPPSGKVCDQHLRLLVEGRPRNTRLYGPSALAAHGGYLYVGYRTSSVVVRLPLDDQGRVRRPLVAELIAEFQPYNKTTHKAANLIDMAFNSRGELFVSCASHGRIWKVGIPDPARVFAAWNTSPRPGVGPRPYANLRQLTDNPKAKCGNIAFDGQDRLYVCSGNYDSGTRMAGTIYRIVEQR